MSIKRRAFGASLTAMLIFAVAGCSSSSSNDGSTGPTSAAADRTLHLATPAAPSSFQIGEWGAGEATLFQSVYDTVVIIDNDGKVVPGLAESWTYSNANTTLTLKVRPGMKFTDGEPVNAAAVTDSLNQSRKGSTTTQNLSSISDVAASDDSTVVITLSRPDAALIYLLGGIAGAVGSPKALTTESSKTQPVGSGPYVLDQATTTQGSVYTLKRNPDNWNAQAYGFATVEFRVIQDATATQNALLAGQLDVTSLGADVAATLDSGQFNTGISKPQAVGGIWLADREGTVVPALKDVRVRQAINMAFDRELITTSINPGSTVATEQVFNSATGAYDPALDKTYAYDVAGAKELMSAAGYADGFDVTMPSTVLSTQYESVVAQALGDIGVRVTWESVPFTDLYAKIGTGVYGMYLLFNGVSGSEAQDALTNLSGIFNPFTSTSPDLQTLLDTANAAELAQQPAAFKAVNEYLVDQAWFAPLFQATGTWVAAKAVTFTPPVVSGLNLLPYSPA